MEGVHLKPVHVGGGQRKSGLPRGGQRKSAPVKRVPDIGEQESILRNSISAENFFLHLRDIFILNFQTNFHQNQHKFIRLLRTMLLDFKVF
jgi:hypothetical protein